MGLDRSINPPGISTTIAHLLQALDEVKPGASALVRRVEDKDDRRHRRPLAAGVRADARPHAGLSPRTNRWSR